MPVRDLPSVEDLGRFNQNPPGIGFWDLVREDYQTYDRKISEPGFWAVFTHRLANARMGISNRWLRLPLTLLARMLYRHVRIQYGIELDAGVKIGRRIRIWHHGCIVMSARAIGDDVHLRHMTTCGVSRRHASREEDLNDRPIIGDRVDIGIGSTLLGGILVGDDAVIAGGSVVIRDVPSGALVGGVPAKILKDPATATATT